MNKRLTSKKYLEKQIESASPGMLVLLLFDGAIRNLNMSKDRISRGLFKEGFKSKAHAQNIIYELLACLNMDAGSIAENLYQLYDYMLDRLISVDLTKPYKAQAEIDEVIHMLKELRSAWKDMIETHN